MLAFLLALCALAGATHAECDACIDGRCYSRTTIISGFPITDQMAIDRMENILYLQLNGNLNVAVSLDHLEIRLINTMRTAGMAVHQASRSLYLGAEETPKTFYTYDPTNNITETISSPNPDFQVYGGNKLLPMLDPDQWNYTYRHLENITVSGLVVDKLFNRVYFISNNTLYVHKNEDQPPKAIFNRDHVALSADNDGEVYIGDASQRLIYKLNRNTEELNVFAAYKTGAVEEFIFEKYNGMLTRDRDGSVVRWVTSGNQGSQYQFHWNRIHNEFNNGVHVMEDYCAVEPPSTKFHIKQLDTICDSYIAKGPGYGYSYGQAVP